MEVLWIDVWSSLRMNVLLVAWIVALAVSLRGFRVGGLWTPR